MRRLRPSAMSLTLWSECKEASLATTDFSRRKIQRNRVSLLGIKSEEIKQRRFR